MKKKKFMSILLIMTILFLIGLPANAEEATEDTSESGWSYSKTFSSADTQATLEEEGYSFSGTPAISDDGISFAVGRGNVAYGKDGNVMDFDYGFDTYVYKTINNYSVNFHYTDSLNYYKLFIVRDSGIIQLIKVSGGTAYVLKQYELGSTALKNYVGHTYHVEVRNTSAGAAIKATVKETNNNGAAYDGLEYSFDYTDTAFDTGYDGLDNGAPFTSGKILLQNEWSAVTMTYLNVSELSDDSGEWSYKHTFSANDTVNTLAADGITFEGIPTISDDGAQVGTSFTYTPSESVVTDKYKFETQIYKTVNSYMLKFNVTDSGYYALYLQQDGTYPGPDFSLRLEKWVGSTQYILARDNFSSGSALTSTTHTYVVEVENATSGCNIKAYVKNERNSDELNIDYTDTAVDTGADGADNGAPLATSGVVTVTKNYSSALIKYFNMYFITTSESEEPAGQSSVLCLVNDRDPYTGVLTTIDAGSLFTFDTAYSSLGLDLGEKTEINNIILSDGNNSNRIHRADLSLYVSDDNVEYTRIKDFTAAKVGAKVYLYNFTANARYIKVHCHHGEVLQDYMRAESFVNFIDDMMLVENVALPGANGGEFTKVKELSVTAEKDLTDSVAFVDSDLLADVSTNPLRFVLSSGYVLSHYTGDDGVYLRIPEAKANTEIIISVYGANAEAADLSDMNSTFEVTYGNKTAYHLNNGNYFRANATVGEAPNGDEILIANDKSITKLHMARSTNGGRTWSEPECITDRPIVGTNDGGGFLIDKERGKMWYVGHFSSVNVNYSPGVLESDDNGLTWTKRPYHVQHDGILGCVYDNGTIAKSYDGDGPAIDYFFPFNTFVTASSGGRGGVAFSRDNGRTWQTSPTYIGFWPEDFELAHEAGVSEGTMAYLSNGDIKTLARNQWPDQNHYCQSVSHDDGFTWEENAWVSNVWASNGDPNLMNIDDNIVLVWPGNTNGNAVSYIRYPLSIAYSTDDMESWTNKMNIWEGTTYGVYNSEYDRSYATQPGFAPVSYKDSDDMYIYWTHHGAGNGVEGASSIDAILVEDFDEYYQKSKGAAEDFEADEAKYENWFQVKAKSYSKATVSISTEQAKSGSRSLKLNANGSPLIANRSMPQLMNGEISYDFYIGSISSGNGLFMDLKGVYNSNPLDGTIYSLRFDKDGNVYILNPDGEYAQSTTAVAALDITKWNNIKIKFDRATDVAKLYINDEEIADMIIGTEMPKIDGVCFIQFYTVSGSQPATVYVDNFKAYEGVKMNAVAK